MFFVVVGPLKSVFIFELTKQLGMINSCWERYLKGTRILHKDVLLDGEYIDNTYSYKDQICNKGGLTLVSKHYYNFADNIITKIRRYAIFEALNKEGNDLLKIIDEKIEESLQL